jgi:hypothetical protein
MGNFLEISSLSSKKKYPKKKNFIKTTITIIITKITTINITIIKIIQIKITIKIKKILITTKKIKS